MPLDTRPLQTKRISLAAADIKLAEDEWQFTGYASTYGGSPDSYGDIVKTGAFDQSLKDNPEPPLLWSHYQDRIVGVPVELKSDRHGLLGTWRIVRHQTGIEAYENLKAGAVKGLSIGFFTRGSKDNEDGTRTLTDIDLVEVSLVAVPANANALVQSVRSLDPLNTDCKFAELFEQLAANFETVAAEAEALATRRAEEERELSAAQIDALTQAIDRAGAFATRLSALRERHPLPAPADKHAASMEAHLRHARYQLTQEMAERRRRYAALAITEPST